MYWSEGMTAIGPKECPNAVSACRRVSQVRRQISSALMVLKKVSTAACLAPLNDPPDRSNRWRGPA
jgi:hypothetical protein